MYVPNEEVVHGIPQDKPLKDGDIISVDCGVLKMNFMILLIPILLERLQKKQNSFLLLKIVFIWV